MKKGVSPAQNIQLLKWSEELGIFCGWNMLTGLPGGRQESYDRMAEMIPKLHHLRPPSGGGHFQLHRFSPYFEDQERFGIRWSGANRLFRHAFPVRREDLDELVYLHDFEYTGDFKPVDTARLDAALKTWSAAYQKGESLRMTVSPDGTSQMVDTRGGNGPTLHQLNVEETELYLSMDSAVRPVTLERLFAETHPASAAVLRRQEGIQALVNAWLNHGLAIEIDGRILSLAIYADRPHDRPESRLEARPLLRQDPPEEGFVALEASSLSLYRTAPGKGAVPLESPRKGVIYGNENSSPQGG
jgi:hypothetical protein